MSVIGVSPGSPEAAAPRSIQPVATYDPATGDAIDAANPSPVRSYGSAAIATSQVTVGTSSTQIVAARSGRVSVTIRNLGTLAFYVGVSGLTTGNGFLVPGAVGAEVTIPTQAAVFGIAAVAQAVSVLETY